MDITNEGGDGEENGYFSEIILAKVQKNATDINVLKLVQKNAINCGIIEKYKLVLNKT